MSLGWDFDFAKLVRGRKLGLYGLPDITHRDWRSLSYLVDRPWFGRAWVIQEVVVARDAQLHCGSSSMTWADFCIGFIFGLGTNLRIFRPDVLTDLLAFEHLVQIIFTSKFFMSNAPNGSDLTTLLESHRTTGAQDLRDKVYALIGLAGMIGDQPGGIVPDYRLPVRDVYLDVAKFILENSATLDMLSVPRVKHKSSIGDLPSWVPDWSIGDFASSLCFKDNQGQQCLDFDASRTLIVPKHLIFNNRALELSGHIFDRVSKVGRLLDPYDGQDISGKLVNKYVAAAVNNWMIAVPHWQSVAECESGRTYPSGEDIFDAYVQTLYLGSFGSGYSFEDAKEGFDARISKAARRYSRLDGSILQRALSFLDSNFTARAWMSLHEQPQSKISATARFSDLLARIIHRRMVMTKQGYIGLAPRMAEEGDCIVLVKGGRVPLIFRSRGAGTWERIGDCYIHGIMHGEAFEEAKCEIMTIV